MAIKSPTMLIILPLPTNPNTAMEQECRRKTK